MKKFAPVLVVVGILILGFLYFMNVKNKALLFSQATEKEWGNVNTAYQRRLDLIDNLVNTVKGAADFEKSTLTAVVEARAKATSVTIDPKNITPAQLDQFNQAQSGITSSLSKLLVSVEAYPQLRATGNFTKLQDELASTENQILTARTRFNQSVEKFNSYILAMPQNIFLGSYTEKAYFKAVAGAENAPKVKF
ncbi:LemA family protein [Flavobacterium sp.]|jgi:LemA protein|uniref:LemA family protein n=1 Tax=Flavobacterium sp. TaxID=239 RepID=UPI0037C0B1C4